MARIVKEEEYTAKRNAILDAAQRIMAAKGYEQLAIQDILNELRISKGAFYHYFGSKRALLEALIERTLAEMERLIAPIAGDPLLPALEKLQRYYDAIVSRKNAQKTFVFALLCVWYTDENAVFRQKMRAAMAERFAPLLAAIIRQGIQEGTLSAAYPEQAGEVAVRLGQDLSDALAGQILRFAPGRDDPRRLVDTAAAYTEAVERVLGAPRGSLRIIDGEMLQEWLAPSKSGCDS